MTRRLDHDRFKGVSRRVGDGYRKAWEAVCCGCSAIGEVVDAGRTALPPEVIAKKLRQQGWDLGASAAQDRCPTCVHPKPEPRVIPMKAEPAKADPPRTPTREDRRRVIDALEEHYDADHERYRASWTDKALAAKLGLPAAWVAEERDRAYGPDTNEQAANRTAETEAIRLDMERVQTELLAQFDALEARLKKLEVDLSYRGAA